MAVMKVLHYPHKVLLTPTQKVISFDDELKLHVKDMIETMYFEKGIGLAANQVGISKNFFVIDTSEKRNEARAIINANIIKKEAPVILDEACLSLPGVGGKISRFAKITVKFQDIDGNEQEETIEGLHAHCFQHEIDHLNGKVYIDRLSSFKRSRIIKKYNKMNED
jgi:peptide deformylase